MIIAKPICVRVLFLHIQFVGSVFVVVILFCLDLEIRAVCIGEMIVWLCLLLAYNLCGCSTTTTTTNAQAIIMFRFGEPEMLYDR